jgi:hypothetical protein
MARPYEFEDFVKRLLRAERYLGPDVRHVAWVQKYGSKGDRQDGIDLRGDYTDGTHAAWQSKHQERLRPFEVRGAVHEVTYEGAEEPYLVYCGVAKQSALEEMDKHEGWTLLDRGDLTDMFRELPLQVQRDILDATWDEDVRRIFLKVPGDAFVSIESFTTERKNADAVMNDLGRWSAGRKSSPLWSLPSPGAPTAPDRWSSFLGRPAGASRDWWPMR